MFATLVLLTVLSSAAPMAIDLAALKSGQVPPAGTREEADSCAAETNYILLDALRTGRAQEAADKVPAMVAWQTRAADFRPMTPTAYSNDEAFVAAVNALTAIDGPTHAALEAACNARLSQ